MGCFESDKHLSALDELKKSLLQQTFGAADRWLQAHPSVTLCPLTSTLRQAPLVRIAVEASGRNGLLRRPRLPPLLRRTPPWRSI